MAHRPILIAQAIVTRWTKASRGMPGAAKRNEVPLALEVPYADLRGQELLVHEVEALESAEFRLRSTHGTAELAQQLSGALDAFRLMHDGAAVVLLFNEAEFGSSPRRFEGRGKAEVLRLTPGSTGRFRINYRLTWAGARETHYYALTANFALLDEFDSRVFVDREPDSDHDRLADLF